MAAKGFLKLPNLVILIQQESITFQKLGSREFWRIANSVLSKGKSTMSPIMNGPEVLSSVTDKKKLFARIFSKNSNRDGSGISLPAFPSSTNLKLHNIHVTPKLVKKVVTNLDLSLRQVLIVFIDFSYILAELFNMCLTESCFPDYWKVSSVVAVFKNVRERSIAKSALVSLLSVVHKVFEKLVTNKLLDHFEKYGP